MPPFSRRTLLQAAAAAPLLAMPCAFAATPINESGFVRIGGIEQWVAVQGDDRANPVILYLHGGPSEAQSPFLKGFMPWEHDFTVANWDQRGAGKTYGRNGEATPDLTLERLINDAIEVAEYLRTHLAQRKVILVGQSWGSFLGVNVIKRRPDLFYAFVGTGQVSGIAAMLEDRVRYAQEQATALGDQETLKALDEARNMSIDYRLDAEAKASRKYVISKPDEAYAKVVNDFIGQKPLKGDAADFMAGAKFTAQKLKDVMDTIDLRALGLDMPIPFFVIQGRDDHITGFAPAKAYTDEIRAPQKAFVAIDGGHYACFTNADEFVAALRKYVRPLAV